MRRPVAGHRRHGHRRCCCLASPFLGVKWGSVDYRVLPPDAPAHVGRRQAQRRVRPGALDREPAAHGRRRGRRRGVHREVEARRRRRRRPPGRRRRATPPCCAPSWEGNSQTEDSQDIVTRPARGRPADGATALVGGLTADTVDLIDSVGAHLPWMGLIVVGGDAGAAVPGVRLGGAAGQGGRDEPRSRSPRRSAWSPGSSATGHLAGLLGFEPQGFLDATNPILMLAILFGLSMDYEVFLLSRVREQWDRTARQRPRGRDRRAEDRPDHHQRRAAARRRDRRVRPQRHRVHEDDRHRHARRAAHRRDRRPGAAGAGHDEAARPLELVGAGPAAPVVGALRLPRDRRPRRRSNVLGSRSLDACRGSDEAGENLVRSREPVEATPCDP